MLASIALKLYKPKVIIGIAGSVGKSSTKNIAHALLAPLGEVTAIGNSETGIPLGILGITPKGYRLYDWLQMLIRAPFGIHFLKGTQFLIVEMGIDDPNPPKNMTYLLTIIQPDIGILVNESAAHTEQFDILLSDKQKTELSQAEQIDYLIGEIAKEDAKMITAPTCKRVIYNAENKFIRNALKEYDLSSNKELFAVGNSASHYVQLVDYSVSLLGTTMSFRLAKDTFTITLPQILPDAYDEVVGLSIALLSIVDDKNITKDYASHIQGALSHPDLLPKGRGSIFKGINNSMLIDSTYNASKISVLTFLTLVSRLKEQTNRPIVCILGDMRELGNESRFEHEEIAKALPRICDYVYLVGPLMKAYVLPILERSSYKNVRWFASNIEAGEYIAENLAEKSIVLLKGSQNTIFLEETIKYLLTDLTDIDKLCRQDDYWLSIKQKQGKLAQKDGK